MKLLFLVLELKAVGSVARRHALGRELKSPRLFKKKRDRGTQQSRSLV